MNKWSLFETAARNRLLLQTAGKSIKYKLRISTALQIAAIANRSIVEVRYLLTLREVRADGGYVVNLITLDNQLLETDNPAFLDMHQLTQQMQKALKELDLHLDSKGHVVEVLNMEAVRAEWEVVKRHALQWQGQQTNLQELFKLQDAAFQQAGGLEKMVKSNELLQYFFTGLYGYLLPHYTQRTMPNIFRTGDIVFDMALREQESAGARSLELEGTVQQPDKKWIDKTYAGFPFLTGLDTSKVRFSYNGRFQVNRATGFVEAGEVNYEEWVTGNLYTLLTYSLHQYA